MENQKINMFMENKLGNRRKRRLLSGITSVRRHKNKKDSRSRYTQTINMVGGKTKQIKHRVRKF